MTAKAGRRTVPALRVRQWLTDWDQIHWDPKKLQAKPNETFLLLSMTAETLRGLSGIQRRTTEGGLPRVRDLGIQRNYNVDRAREISRFVKVGYPCSEVAAKRLTAELDDLRKPGWLPTAIVLNILPPGGTRAGLKLATKNEVVIRDSGGRAEVEIPAMAPLPGELPPFEIIDGQHRLYSFGSDPVAKEYELPVVAFENLDISWQAYLFWTINIKPKRISASMAFDLYPLLRTEDWLERFSHYVYRETRAQELVEALWNNSKSPWRGQINMLGETKGARSDKRQMVTQAAWIRSLTSTFVRSFEGRAVKVGGIFGAPTGKENLVIPWNRAQQAAFLIYCWEQVRLSVAQRKTGWARALREAEKGPEESADMDPAFAGPLSLLTTDQGVRGVHYAFNDLCCVRADSLKLAAWRSANQAAATDQEAVNVELKAIGSRTFAPFVQSIAKSLGEFDWRTSAAPGLSDEERRAKSALRGGTGYRLLREDLLRHLRGSGGDIRTAASTVMKAMGYNP